MLRTQEQESALEGTAENADAATTQAAQEERGKLQSHFGSRDILFYPVCILVGMDTIGAVARNGAQEFTWLAFLGVFFFLPYGLQPDLGGRADHAVGAFGDGGVDLVRHRLVWHGGSGGRRPAGGFGHQRLAYELIQNVPLALRVLLGLLFYRLGKPTRDLSGP